MGCAFGPVEEFTVRVPAATPGEVKGTFRRTVLATKAQATATAIRQLAPHVAADGYVLSAQNGLNEIEIGTVVGEARTMGCFVNFGADWHGPGEILFGNRGAVVVGEIDGRTKPRTTDMFETLQLFEPDAVLTDNIWGYLWGKLAYGAQLFATALTPDSMADNFADPRRTVVFETLGREVMAVAARAASARSASTVSIPRPSRRVRRRRAHASRLRRWRSSTATRRRPTRASGATSPCASARPKSTRRSASSPPSAARSAWRRRRSPGSWS